MTTFNVYRRESNDTNPPVAIATGLTSMSYSDATAEFGKEYLYSVGAVKNGFEEVSEEISILAGGDVYINFVEFIIRQLDTTKDVSRDFKDVSPRNSTITKVGDPVVVNPFFGQPCIVMNAYHKYSTAIPVIDLVDFCLELDYASLGGGEDNGRICSITNSAQVGSVLINKTTNTMSSNVNVMINDGNWKQIIASSRQITDVHDRIILFRLSGIFYLSFSGEIVGSSNSFQNYSITATHFFYNGWHTQSDYVHGVFGQCRLTVGNSRYTNSSIKFKPQPFPENLSEDLLFNSVAVLAKPTKNGLIDKSQNARVFTADGWSMCFTGEQIQDEPIIFFDGQDSGISIPIPSLETGDFALEFNYNLQNYWKALQRLGQIGSGDGVDGSCVFVQSISNGNAVIEAHLWISGAYRVFRIIDTLPRYQSGHICFMRKDGVFYAFLNGVKVNHSTDPIFLNYRIPSATTITLGKGANPNTGIQCAIHGVRFTRYARYPITGFDRPTESFYTH